MKIMHSFDLQCTMLLIIIGLCLSVALFDQDFLFFFKQLPKTLNTLAALLTKTSEGYKCPLLAFAAEKFCRPTVV